MADLDKLVVRASGWLAAYDNTKTPEMELLYGNTRDLVAQMRNALAEKHANTADSALHLAVCQAVYLMNHELQNGGNLEAHRILRQALVDYADKSTVPTVSGELKRQSAWHAEQADAYAERSHEVSEGEMSDAYSSLSEAHHQISEVMAKQSGTSDPQTVGEM